VVASAKAANALVASPCEWDDAVRDGGGHLLQSWRWGEFKKRHGWDVERFAVVTERSVSLAQVLFRSRGPVAIAYIPRGPVFDPRDNEGLRNLFARIDAACKKRRALYLMIEPDSALPFTGSYKSEGFVRGSEHFQPSRTVKIPLLPDVALLAQMHQKTRYSVRLAERRGVEMVRSEATAEAVDDFYRLLEDTSARNEFGIHSHAYYRDFLEIFEDDALLLFAKVEGVVAAGLIAAKFNEEAIYMYGASSTEHRAHGGAFALQFEAMRWARDHGALRYDLWGIPREDPVSTSEDDMKRVAGTRGNDWRGLFKFKTGFGGQVVTYPPTLERRYHPALAFAARRLNDRSGV
jgi:peptidoglycan pentaglycine glycine transferase (the first glycine)